MTQDVEGLVRDFEENRLTRRELVAAVLALVATGGSEAAGQPTSASQVARVAQARSLNHVSIAVSSPERAAEFYQGLLGLDVVSRPGNGGINLGLGDGFLGLYALPDVGRPHHFCLGVDDFDPERIAAALTRLGLEARVDTNPRNRTSGGDQLYFNDPDGTVVQLCANGYQG